MIEEKQLSNEAIRTAMRSPEHLKAWLEASGRNWIVFNGPDLVDALPFPDGVQAFMHVVMAYRDHRRAQTGNRTEEVVNPKTKKLETIPVMRTDALELEEIDRCIRFMIGQATSINPDWKL